MSVIFNSGSFRVSKEWGASSTSKMRRDVVPDKYKEKGSYSWLPPIQLRTPTKRSLALHPIAQSNRGVQNALAT